MHKNSRRIRILPQEVRRLRPHLLVRYLLRLLYRRLQSCNWMMNARQVRRFLLVGGRGPGDRRFCRKRPEWHRERGVCGVQASRVSLVTLHEMDGLVLIAWKSTLPRCKGVETSHTDDR